MEDRAQDTLRRQLDTVNTSVGFLLLLVFSILLSLQGVLLQRQGLRLTLRGRDREAQALPPVYPIRHAASALVVGALGYFLCLALEGMAQAGDDPEARRSAGVNLWASLLVLAAAILRYIDLESTQRLTRQPVEEDLLPD